MENLGFALDGAWKVLLTGLLLGAGLPAVFALGVRSMAWGAGGDAEASPEPGHPLGRVLAALCFAVVLAGIALGIAIIVASGLRMEVSFDHLYPTFEKKH